MSDRKMTMGLIVGSRGFFPHHLAKSGREEMMAALAKLAPLSLTLPPLAYPKWRC